MPTEQSIVQILAYVQQHRASFDLDVLRQQLLAAGYASEDVAAAFERLSGQQPMASAEPATALVPLAQPDITEQATIAHLADYLQQHRERYSSEALRQQLLRNGQRPDLVEAALARVEPPVAQGRRAWPVALLLALANLPFAPIAAWLLNFVWQALTYANAYLELFLLVLVLELVVGALLWASGRAVLGKALVFGTLLSVAMMVAFAVVAAALFLGVCFVILRSIGIGV